ncbi:VF530 family protein [uncultured Sphaerochaeta sp.]|uniref:VF530 family protein n=1 Tax=uncultured Sphaerochaeta sp. TaxID=886478 RepID=UPI002A0A6D5F|nr:VF530 family protein [uncultured Sphaerochaeta sp.]
MRTKSDLQEQPNNPLHGVTLEQMLRHLVMYYGWRELYYILEIRCFYNDPGIKSSLKFLRQTPWARAKVEEIYLDLLEEEKESSENETDF